MSLDMIFNGLASCSCGEEMKNCSDCSLRMCPNKKCASTSLFDDFFARDHRLCQKCTRTMICNYSGFCKGCTPIWLPLTEKIVIANPNCLPSVTDLVIDVDYPNNQCPWGQCRQTHERVLTVGVGNEPTLEQSSCMAKLFWEVSKWVGQYTHSTTRIVIMGEDMGSRCLTIAAYLLMKLYNVPVQQTITRFSQLSMQPINPRFAELLGLV